MKKKQKKEKVDNIFFLFNKYDIISKKDAKLV